MKTKQLLAFLLAGLMLLSLVSCTGTEENDTTSAPATQAETEGTTAAPVKKTEVNIGVLKGPTGMGAAYLMELDDKGETVNDYSFTVAGAPDVLVSGMISGETDIAALPTNSVATIYQKTKGKVIMLSVNTLGVLYVLAKEGTVTSFADLEGKTIVSAGQGSTAEYVLNYILSNNSLEVGKDVTVNYLTEHAEVSAQAVAGKADVVVLPEPFVTALLAKDAGFEIAIDLTKEWKTLTGAELTMGAFAVNKTFADENPEAVAAFLSEIARSAAYVNSNISEAAALIEKYDIMTAAVASQAITRANIVCMTGDEMKTAVKGFFEVISGFDASAIGGAMPADDFYYAAK